METYKITTIFRKWPDGTIEALFPYEINTPDGYCLCYAHIGQHSNADYFYCISKTKPAMPHEYNKLLIELKNIGYSPIIRKRK